MTRLLGAVLACALAFSPSLALADDSDSKPLSKMDSQEAKAARAAAKAKWDKMTPEEQAAAKKAVRAKKLSEATALDYEAAKGQREARPIDLNVPANLEYIKSQYPDHYAKIQRILDELPRQPPNASEVAKWMRTNFEARNVGYSAVVMTSLPPKHEVRFTLDDTMYFAVVTVSGWGRQAVIPNSIERKK